MIYTNHTNFQIKQNVDYRYYRKIIKRMTLTNWKAKIILTKCEIA